MSNLPRHADALAKRGVRMNRLAEIHRVRAHLNRQCNLTNHDARECADQATAQYFCRDSCPMTRLLIWGRFVFVVKSDGRKASIGAGVLD